MLRFALCFGIGLWVCGCKPVKPDKTDTDKTNEVVTIAPSRQCFILAEGQDTTFVTLVVAGDGTVGGYMQWSPWQKDGGYGDLDGTMMSNEIKAIWSYVIEGSNQQEEIFFKLEDGKLLRKKGELKEVDPSNPGSLTLKDPGRAQYLGVFVPGRCYN